MRKEEYIISDFCIIRNNRAIVNGELIFSAPRHNTAAFLTALYRHLDVGYAKFFKMDSLCKLGFLASELILRKHDPILPDQADDTGLILANAASSIDSDRNHQRSIADHDAYFPSPSVFVYTLANIVAGEISIRHKLHGENAFFIDRQFDPVRMHAYATQLFDEDIIKRCLMGWVELDGDRYEAVLYFIQKSAGHKDGIAIFEPGKLNDIYLQGSDLWNN